MASENIEVTVGGEFSVRLPSTPSTGYAWQVSALPEGVQSLGSSCEKPANGLQPGDPITQVFRFRGHRVGEYPVGFVLQRKWEREPAGTHMVHVKVKP